MPMQVVHPLPPPVPRDRLLRLPQVELLTGSRKSFIYQMVREGRFPKSVALGGRTVAWSENAVLQWVQDRITEAQAAQAKGGL